MLDSFHIITSVPELLVAAASVIVSAAILLFRRKGKK